MKGLCRLTQVYKQSYRYPKGKDTVASAVAEEGNYRRQIRWLMCRQSPKRYETSFAICHQEL